MKHKNLIVFDMDGVLVDVSKSYRETIRQTAGLFFKMAPSSEKLPEPLFPLADLAAVKQSGGLNNDWDLSCLVISLLFHMIEQPAIYDSEDPMERYRETIRRCHVNALAEFLNSRLMEVQGAHVADRHELAGILKRTGSSLEETSSVNQVLRAARLVGADVVIRGAYQHSAETLWCWDSYTNVYS